MFSQNNFITFFYLKICFTILTIVAIFIILLKINNIFKYLTTNSTNWTSGNKKIVSFIQERQLKIDNYDDIVLEWIPYDQFNEIKETGKNEFMTVYSAIWKDGPLYKENSLSNYTRDSNKEVSLKCLHNSQESIDSLIDEANKYPIEYNEFHALYGISQIPDTGDYILVLIWTSGNEKIDGFIQERQLKINNYDDVVLEWIPYNQFNEIKETEKNELMTVYSAIWKDGPLYKENSWSNYTRDSNKEVSLKCLHNSQEFIDSLIDEANKYPIEYNEFHALYGISQIPDTGDYILVLIWTSGNEKIDDFILKRQLKINNYDDVVLEWIPYNQFNEIRETGKNGLITVYSAIWKDGPSLCHYGHVNYRSSNKKVSLKCLHNSQGSIDSLINEAKKYPTKCNSFQVLYGISQNPDTGDYIFIQNNCIWTSGNEKIDDFILKKQLKVKNYDDIVLEWIPYNQLNKIKETSKNGLITVYSAIWKDGPLLYYGKHINYRDLNKEVTLKYLHNSQESIDSLINEAKKYLSKHKAFQVLYGISQNPDTGDYILVFEWTSGNKNIDDFLQKKKLGFRNYNDIIFEWIAYNQLNEIKETGKNGLITVYSAIWKDNRPLLYHGKHLNYKGSNKKVALKCLHNSQESINSLINEAKKYPKKYEASQILFGISQNPDTEDYILVFNWTSGNEKIDDFILERQLNINNFDDTVLEWIPYNQFNEIKMTGKNELTTVYLAIWKDGPIHKKNKQSNYIRDSYKEVSLKCIHNSQESIDSLIDEAKKYPIEYNEFYVLYGISQNPDTADYILVFNWTSGNEKIDDFILERQLNINYFDDIVLEWIPYNQFNEIERIGKNELTTVYSAIWKDGLLYKKYSWSNYTRDSNKEVALKCLHNSQESIDSLINEAKKYPIKYKAFQVVYGISQNPDTGDYILVLNWTSGNEKIDDFILERQLNINNFDNKVLEWIPYIQFNEIERIGKNELTTVYSAIWKDGPLCYQYGKYTRNPNKKIALKCSYNSQGSIDSLINKVKKYSTIYKEFQVVYGISQNPNTEDYILVFSWTSGNEKIDDFILGRQLRIINHFDNIVLEWLEWIPYNQFNELKETGKNGLITVYSAIWKDGPLKWYWKDENYTRDSNKKVALKYLHNLQESIDSLIYEARKYLAKYKPFQILYGISQSPNTGDYILVLNWTSGNEKIDDFIQEKQLKIENYDDIVLEWIPYNQLNEIKETGKNGLITVYSAIWKDGPLCKKNKKSNYYTRDSNKKVSLKCLHNLQESTDSLINKAKTYSTKREAFQALYGISQNPDTRHYILVLIWASGNDKIDDFIQKRQLKINNNDDIVLEWIPYSQFNEIKEIVKNGSVTIYSAIWKDGPFYWNNQNEEYTRDPNKKVSLKYLYNLQDSIDYLINEAKKYSAKYKAFQVLYGISQNLDTRDYILVQNYCMYLENWFRENEKIDDFIQEMKINDYNDIVFEQIPYNQFNEIKMTGKNDLITVYSAIWKDGPLHYHYSQYTRDSNKEVALKCIQYSHESIDSLINEAKKYLTKHKAFQILYGISLNPDTGDYILVFNWTSGNENIDVFIQEMQLKINHHSDIMFEWIPYNQFVNIKEIGKGGFAMVHSANWKNGPLEYNAANKAYKRNPNRVIALKCLHNSQNISNKFLNEVKKYSINIRSNILNIYGISQNLNTNEYIMVLQYAKEGNFNHWINENYKYFNWKDKLSALKNIINGLKEIHQNNIVHRDFHTGNILFLSDINEFASGRQPFDDYAHDYNLALDICKGVRPEINEPEAPRCYIELMKKCWDLNPNNRPNIFEVNELIASFYKLYDRNFFTVENEEIGLQFKKAEEYRKANLPFIKNHQITTHPQAIYTSRLLNPFTEDLPEYDDNSQCLDQVI
ncbi:uncharacterized protein OCT59_008359 [Rhizophagus irregularis]|uniref:uncharacterized protein n=1 Tax=Rhizophagus irregularis TaxID=588596 RepID=UPI00331F2061|nr:hypothetical protein OCT59_008359 [Rhizophagus irregularis]